MLPLLQRPYLRKSRQIEFGFTRGGAGTFSGPFLREDAWSGPSSSLFESEEEEPLEDVTSEDSVEARSELESDMETLESREVLSIMEGESLCLALSKFVGSQTLG